MKCLVYLHERSNSAVCLSVPQMHALADAVKEARSYDRDRSWGVKRGVLGIYTAG
jgi:hypothetical protein